jgi:hypothetical protein
VFPLRKDTPV